MIGIRNFFKVVANIVVTNSAALVTTGLTSPVAVNQKQKFRAWIPFSVGATGGVRAQVVVPAGGTLFNVTIKLYNTVAPSLTTAIQAASAVFTNALANAGSHWLEIEGEVDNGATAGSIDIKIAQNTADALSLTVLQGGSMDIVIQ
jgi:hypothetical protein